MCSPTLAVSGLSTVAGFAGKRQDYKNQVAANAATVNSLAAQRDADLMALADQRVEAREDAATDSSDAARAAAILRARTLVASGEQGAGGNTAARLLRDVNFQAGSDAVRRATNLERELRQNDRERAATIARAENGRSSLPQPTKPSALAAGLTFAGDALGSGLTLPTATKRARVPTIATDSRGPR